MAPQTSYSATPGKGLAGQIADTGPRRIESYTAEEAVPFGLGVAQGTADDLCGLPADGNAKLLGIAVRTHAHDDLDADGVVAKEPVGIMTQGPIYVVAEGAVVKGGDVYVRHTAGAGGATIGAIRADADTATAIQLTGAAFAESGADGELVKVVLNRP